MLLCQGQPGQERIKRPFVVGLRPTARADRHHCKSVELHHGEELSKHITGVHACHKEPALDTNGLLYKWKNCLQDTLLTAVHTADPLPSQPTALCKESVS